MIRKMLRNGWFWVIVLLFIMFYSNYQSEGPRFLNGAESGNNAILCSKTIKVPEEVKNLQESFRNVAQTAKKAVVSISTVHVEDYEYYSPYEFFFGDPFEEFFGSPREAPKKEPKKYQRKFEGMGSGVIIDPKGLILTNEHVVRDADEIKVHLVDKEKPLSAEVIGKDARTDLAIVKIKQKGEYPSLNLADSGLIKVGDWAIAIGSPFGLEQTVTVGVISAVRQSLSIEGQQYRDLIQTDAAINRGNSGGPLLNIEGEVIGINTAIYAPTGVFAGIGFAIPINRAKDILDDLIHKGKVVRGWLGVEIKKVDDVIAQQFGMEKPGGALINYVFGDSPADKAGLKRGDIIIEFDGKEVNDVAHLQDIVASTPPKKKVAVAILRNKKHINLSLITGEMPSETEIAKGDDEEDDGVSDEWLGIKTKNLNSVLAKRYRLPAVEEGVVIVSLDESKEAASAGVREGDLIKSINQNETPNVKAFNKAVKSVDTSGGIVFDIIREGKPLYISFVMEK